MNGADRIHPGPVLPIRAPAQAFVSGPGQAMTDAGLVNVAPDVFSSAVASAMPGVDLGPGDPIGACSRCWPTSTATPPAMGATTRATAGMAPATGVTTRATEAMRPILLLRWRKTAPPWWPTGQALSSARLTPGFTALSAADSRDTAGSPVGGHSGRATGEGGDPVGMGIDRVGTEYRPGWGDHRPGWGDHRPGWGRSSAGLGWTSAPVVALVPVCSRGPGWGGPRPGFEPRGGDVRPRRRLRRRFRRRGRPGRRGQRRIGSWGWPSRWYWGWAPRPVSVLVIAPVLVWVAKPGCAVKPVLVVAAGFDDGAGLRGEGGIGAGFGAGAGAVPAGGRVGNAARAGVGEQAGVDAGFSGGVPARNGGGVAGVARRQPSRLPRSQAGFAGQAGPGRLWRPGRRRARVARPPAGSVARPWGAGCWVAEAGLGSQAGLGAGAGAVAKADSLPAAASPARGAVQRWVPVQAVRRG